MSVLVLKRMLADLKIMPLSSTIGAEVVELRNLIIIWITFSAYIIIIVHTKCNIMGILTDFTKLSFCQNQLSLEFVGEIYNIGAKEFGGYRLRWLKC